MDLGLQGKSVLVVASSTGLGCAIAVGFGGEGAHVTLCARSEQTLAEAAGLVEAAGGEANPVVCDITDERAIRNVVERADDRFGGVDVLVTNCGGPPPGLFEEVGEAAWRQAFDQVFLSVVRFTQAVLPHMKEKKWGRIVPIVSISAKQPIENLLVSNTLRPGIVGLAKTLAGEVGRHGITVNCVAPSYTRTDRLQELAEYRSEKTGEHVDQVFDNWAAGMPVGRLGKPEELADLVLFLASEKAAFLTGNTVAFDGGSSKGLF